MKLFSRFFNPTPHPGKSDYEEICEIKSRLFKDMLRLEALQGQKTASENIRRILHEVRM